jgi:hypothetical protein
VVCEERKAPAMPLLDLCLIRPRARAGEPPVQLGVPLLDEYLRFLCGRCRPNTVLAAAYDLKVFFTVVGKEPGQVRPADVLAFVTAQRSGRASIGATLTLVDDDWSGVSLPTVRFASDTTGWRLCRAGPSSSRSSRRSSPRCAATCSRSRACFDREAVGSDGSNASSPSRCAAYADKTCLLSSP